MNYNRLFNLRFVNYISSCFLLISSTVATADTAAKQAEAPAKTLVSHAISMHGQPKYPADFKHFEYASPKALKGGSLKEHALGTFDSLNPFITKGTPASNLSLIYDTLTTSSMDEPFTQYGLVAEKIEYPEDRSWVIYHLNPNARFHDGKQITADDVVFSFTTLTTKGAPLYAYYYADIKEAVALDKQRVRFNFSSTTNKELALIIGQLPVLPAHYWKEKNFDQSSLDVPLGSGPYKVKRVDAGRSIIYERVADYWAKDLAVNVGHYNFDEIIIDYYRDDTVAIEALKAGHLDFRPERIAKSWHTSYDIPAAKDGFLKKQSIRDYSPRGMQAFFMNLRRAPFNNIKFRQALNYAFDFEWANRNLFYDSYTRTNSYFFNSDLASSGLPEGRELEILSAYKKDLPASVFTEPYTNPTTDGSGNNRTNLRKAQQLLSEAGYKIVNGKLIDPATQKPVVIEFLERDPGFERILNPYAQSLKRLGIEMNIRMVDTSQYINRVQGHNFDMTTLAIGQSQSPGNEQRDYWSSNAADVQGSSNYMGIKNPAIDALIELVINAPDRDELIVRTRALDRALLHHHYVVPHWNLIEHRLVYWDKFGQPDIAPAFDRTFSTGILTWWVDPEKAKRINARKK